MLSKKFLSSACFILTVVFLTLAQISAATITDLGALGDPTTAASRYSRAYAVSANGYVIVGSSLDGVSNDHAFKYIGTKMTDLGALGDPTTAASRESYASGVSGDGSVIVGYGDNGTLTHAFKYVGTTMTDLGALGDPTTAASRESYAFAVSRDGSVIVGESFNGTVSHAFKYIGTTMTDLGALGDPTSAASHFSGAYAVSADGSVIVGESYNGTVSHAFKYVGTTMTDLGALGTNPANDSYAYGVSADGSVIVGESYNGTATHAFKYVGTTMTDLGALGTNPANDSCANAVSADGSVIVGSSTNDTTTHAFKYVGTTMIDLGALGDPTTAASRESRASGVSGDGSVIVGYSYNGTTDRAFVYTDSGMLDAVEWMQSISGPAGILPMVNSLTSLTMEGAHHRPLMSLDAMGKKSQSWVTGDFGARSRTSDSHTTSGEAGVSGTFGRVVAGLAVGHSEQNNDLLFGGSSNISGQYILGEVDIRLSDNKSILSLTTMLGNWKSKTLRGYGTGNGVDYSLGLSSLNSTSARLRINGAPRKLIRGSWITPYASFTWSRTTADAYDESGGSYDAHFNRQSHDSKEGHVGVSTNFKLGKDTTLLTTLEWIHRFDKSESGFSGTDIDHGALPFDVAGAAIHSNQARLGIDVDHKVNPTTMLNFSAHVTSVGEAPDVSTGLSLRRAF